MNEQQMDRYADMHTELRALVALHLDRGLEPWHIVDILCSAIMSLTRRSYGCRDELP